MQKDLLRAKCEQGSHHLLVFLAMLLPFGRNWSSGVLVAILLLGLLQLLTGKGKLIPRIDFPQCCMIGFWLLTVVSFFYSSNSSETAFKIQQKLALVLFPIILSSVRISRLIKLKILEYYVLSVFIALAFCYLKAGLNFYKGSDNSFFYSNFSFWMHPSYFALHLAFASAILLIKLFNKNSEQLNLFPYWAIISLFVFFQAGIINTSSKAGILADIVVLFALAFSIIKSGKLRLLLFGLLLSIGVSGVVLVQKTSFGQKTRLIEFVHYLSKGQSAVDATDSSVLRNDIMKATIKVMKDNFWIGTGAGDVSDELGKYYTNHGSEKSADMKMNAHNQYFQNFIGLGVIGFVLLLVLLGYGFYISQKETNFLFASFLSLFSIHFIFEAMLERQNGLFFFCMFYLILLGSQENKFVTETNNGLE